jgi:hypothetical protein
MIQRGSQIKRRECHHRGSDHEDDAGGEAVEIDVEPPAELDQREIEQDKPKAADEEEAAELSGAPLATIEKSRKSREKDEGGRAKMRDPACEE